jgi:hypothetical protein
MRTLCTFAFCVSSLLTVARPLGAQQTTSSSARAFTGALAGAAAGALVGGVAGGYIGGNRCTIEGNPDSCYLIVGTAVGLAVGVTLGAPVGAHLLNRRQGNLGLSMLASTGIGVAGFLALRHADEHVRGSNRTATLNAILIGTPLLQVASSALIEAMTGRAR